MQVRQYVIRRLLKLPLVLFAVTVIVFGLSRVGGNPIAIYLEHDFSQEQLAVLFGIGLGTYAGARRNRFADHLTRVLTVSGASLPLFWFALLMVILFYLVIPIAPLGRFEEGPYSQIVHVTGFYTVDAVLNLNV